MFFRKNKSALNTEALASLIDRSVTIVGEITFDKGARIDGVVRGNVKGSMSKNNVLIVGPQAEIFGNIQCQSLVVLGTIKGNVATNYLEIRSSASIHGDISYETIEMYQGSEINGHLFRLKAGVATETPDAQPIALVSNASA
ncbi:MAG: bactofilin family protein [Limnohabitans sp.]